VVVDRVDDRGVATLVGAEVTRGEELKGVVEASGLAMVSTVADFLGLAVHADMRTINPVALHQRALRGSSTP
jgi:hypothetical protein